MRSATRGATSKGSGSRKGPPCLTHKAPFASMVRSALLLVAGRSVYASQRLLLRLWRKLVRQSDGSNARANAFGAWALRSRFAVTSSVRHELGVSRHRSREAKVSPSRRVGSAPRLGERHSSPETEVARKSVTASPGRVDQLPAVGAAASSGGGYGAGAAAVPGFRASATLAHTITMPVARKAKNPSGVRPTMPITSATHPSGRGRPP
jgi:hypothetical protein